MPRFRPHLVFQKAAGYPGVRTIQPQCGKDSWGAPPDGRKAAVVVRRTVRKSMRLSSFCELIDIVPQRIPNRSSARTVCPGNFFGNVFRSNSEPRTWLGPGFRLPFRGPSFFVRLATGFFFRSSKRPHCDFFLIPLRHQFLFLSFRLGFAPILPPGNHVRTSIGG